MTDADIVVLGLLSSGAMHGHGMWNRMTDCEIEDWAEVSRAQVYYSLSKLARRKLISLSRDASAETSRERQTWRITSEGRRALKSTLASDHWTTSRRVSPFVTWVGWSELASAPARKKIVAKRRTFLESEINRKHETLASAKNLPPDTPALRITITMVEYGIRQLQLELDWLKELDQIFEN